MPLVKAVSVRITAEGYEDAKLKIDRLKVSAEELGREHPEIKPQVDSAKALIEARLLAAGIKRELAQGINGSGGGNFLQNTLFKGFSSAAGSAPPGGLLLGGLAAAAAGPALAELTGLGTGVAAATAGIGAFAAFAIPTLKQVETAYTAITNAQTAYSKAAEKEKVDPTAANAKAVQTALVNLKVAQDQAGTGTMKIINGLHGIGAEFKAVSAAIQPSVEKVITQTLQIAGKFIPIIGQFAMAAAPAIEKFMGALSKKMDSQGFKDLVNHLVDISPAAITAIGDGILQVAGAFGKLLEVMSKKDVIHTINIAFDALKDIIQIVSGVVHRLMDNWDQMSKAAETAWNDIYVVVARVVGRVIVIMRSIVDAAATAFGWIPGIGPKLKDAQKHFDAFSARVTNELSVISGQANAAATMVYSIGDAATQATAKMNRLPGVSTGGPVARAGGGVTGRGELTLVGELGPELVRMPAGSRVYTSAQSAQMMGGAGGGGVLELRITGGSRAFRTFLQQSIRVNGGDPAVIGR